MVGRIRTELAPRGADDTSSRRERSPAITAAASIAQAAPSAPPTEASTAPSAATPNAPPSCRDALNKPPETPAAPAGAPDTTRPVIGTITIGNAIPASSIAQISTHRDASTKIAAAMAAEPATAAICPRTAGNCGPRAATTRPDRDRGGCTASIRPIERDDRTGHPDQCPRSDRRPLPRLDDDDDKREERHSERLPADIESSTGVAHIRIGRKEPTPGQCDESYRQIDQEDPAPPSRSDEDPHGVGDGASGDRRLPGSVVCHQHRGDRRCRRTGARGCSPG